jgi:hypothetical protein
MRDGVAWFPFEAKRLVNNSLAFFIYCCHLHTRIEGGLASGQQTKLSYPNSKEISYGYNASGNLLTVGDTVTDFVKAIGYNQNKQILVANFNNELTTAYEYNKDNLRLTKLITGRTEDFHFTDPTYISYDRKDHTAFREFLNMLKEVSK